MTLSINAKCKPTSTAQHEVKKKAEENIKNVSSNLFDGKKVNTRKTSKNSNYNVVFTRYNFWAQNMYIYLFV